MTEKPRKLNMPGSLWNLLGRGVKGLWPYAFLTALTAALLFGPVPDGCMFGSEGDWYSQHVGAAEALRQTMQASGTLLPPWTGVGGGSSIYDLAYYGLLRPDLVLSCLLPNTPMIQIISAYAAAGVIAAVCLLYRWLQTHGLSVKGCLAGAVLFAAASGFFHAHHQIIFVNYMPFLILALMGVDRFIGRKRGGLLAAALTMVYLHSFFYAFSCLLACFLYYLYRCGREDAGEKQRKRWIRSLPHAALAVVISMAAAGALLLPTALAILTTGKEIGGYLNAAPKAVDLSLPGLLYQPYGCGMTLIALFCLITALKKKELRLLAAALLAVMALPVVSYVLNGFLYARAKILIPFLPLAAMLCAMVLEDFWNGRKKPDLRIACLCLVPALFSKWQQLILLDGAILLAWAGLLQLKRLPERARRTACAMILLVPVCVSMGVNRLSEDYLSAGDDRQSHFTAGDITMFAEDDRYRYDVLANNFVNSNLLADGCLNKTAMYSSISNGDYNRFYYDTMKNPISLRNRVVMMPSVNGFFNYFMGIRYLVARADWLPDGYSPVFERNGYVLAENPDVRPMVFGSYDLLSQKDYEELAPLQRMEALCVRTVVSGKTTKGFQSGLIPVEDTAWLETPLTEGKSGTVRLPETLENQILVVSFDVEYNGWRDLVIELGGVRNCLSGRGAPYPNENRRFTFVIPAKKPASLELSVPTQKFGVSDLQVWALDRDRLGEENIAIPESSGLLDRAGGQVFDGRLAMDRDGYLATSLPWKEGYTIYVDGVWTEPERINTAFLGTRLAAGDHHVSIWYEPPGFGAGKAMSAAGLLGFAVMTAGERILFRRKRGK